MVSDVGSRRASYFVIGIKGKTTFAIRAWTYPIGHLRPEDERLLLAGREALRDAVGSARAGARTGDVSASIQGRIERDGYSVARDFVGYGIGQNPHEDPPIPGVGNRGRGRQLVSGQILSIYVIALAGRPEAVMRGEWTEVTVDGGRAVSYSHMIVVLDGDPEVLTSERTSALAPTP